MTQDVSGFTVNQNIPPPYPRFGNLAGADWVCTFAAYNAGLVPNWNGLDLVYKALLSTSTVDARDRLQIKGRLYTPCGRLIADASNVWSGDIYSAVLDDEYCRPAGEPGHRTYAWTGTRSDGTYSGHSCNDWRSSYFTDQGTLGDVQSDYRWLDIWDQGCDKTAHARRWSE